MKRYSESFIIFILFLVQFIDVLDFMVVMPLGPDFAQYLGLPQSKLGWTAGAYTLAAAVSGILTSTFIDKFDRKKVLILVIAGLALANILSANSETYMTLLLARFVAGIFGGPATSICFAIVADLFDDGRRGRVMGKVMGGFSAAAILGVPLGLNAAIEWGWAASFYVVAILCVLVIILVLLFMPKIESHLEQVKVNKVTYLSLLNNPLYRLAFLAVSIGSIASFMIIPYFSPFLQMNLNFPRDRLDEMYLLSGLASFIAMRIAGKYVDKTSCALVTKLSNIFVIFTLVFCFEVNVAFMPILFVCIPFMVGVAIRNVSNFTLYSKLPNAHDRAGFMSIVSCVQHLACSFGSFLTASIVSQTQTQLLYMEHAVLIAIILFIAAPYVIEKIEKSR